MAPDTNDAWITDTQRAMRAALVETANAGVPALISEVKVNSGNTMTRAERTASVRAGLTPLVRTMARQASSYQLGITTIQKACIIKESLHAAMNSIMVVEITNITEQMNYILDVLDAITV